MCVQEKETAEGAEKRERVCIPPPPPQPFPNTHTQRHRESASSPAEVSELHSLAFHPPFRCPHIRDTRASL